MQRKVRKWTFAGIRLVVCCVALAWVLNNVTYYDYVTIEGGVPLRAIDVGAERATLLEDDGTTRTVACQGGDCHTDDRIIWGLKSTWHSADTSLLLLSFVVFAPVPLIQSWRFQLMLRAQEIPVSFWESVKLCYAGNFLNFVTALGSTGGDVFKMYYVSLHTDRKTEAVVTVFLDRVIGLYGLLLLLVGAIVLRLGDSKLAVLTYGVGVIFAAGLVAAAVLFSDTLRGVARRYQGLNKLPFAAQLQRAEAATRRLAKHKWLVILSLASTVVLQGVAMTSFMIAGFALGMRSDPAAVADYYAYLPAGMVIAAVPISFMGLGTMEAFFKHAFLDSHGSLSAILCLAMMIRVVTLFWSLPGVIVTLTGAYRPRISEEEVQLA